MRELKPCPFCGSEAVYSTEQSDAPFSTICHFVTCSNNCLEGLYASGDTKEDTIKAWNKRRSPWHTGKPAKDGKYIVLWFDKDEEEEKCSILFWQSYLNCWCDEETPHAMWGNEENAEVIAWIEEYKEDKK